MNRYSVSIGQDLSKNMSFSGVTKKNPEQTIHKLWYFTEKTRKVIFHNHVKLSYSSPLWTKKKSIYEMDFKEFSILLQKFSKFEE